MGSTGVAEGEVEENGQEGRELTDEEKTRFRGLAARLKYVAQDRVDVQFAVKEVCRGMASPNEGHWRRLKKLGRYHLNREAGVIEFPWGERANRLDVYGDSDWAGCRTSRRSTSGE